MEAILQGWLTKSPPEKKQFKLFGSKWRKRYFVLYAPPTVDGIPDAYTAILEYYSSKKLHHKCGTINLTDCEEVLSSLDSEIYRYVFGLRTMHKSHLRTYYLAADTEAEMNKWVNRLCQVLGLMENDDNLSPLSQLLSKSGLPTRSHTTQPMGIPGNARQTFQPGRSLIHHSQPALAPHSGGLLSPAPPPLRPVPSTPAAPFSRLNISEPNLLDASKSYPENRRDVTDDGFRMASPPGSSRIASPPGTSSGLRSAGSIPELDRFSPTTRKPGNFPGVGREFMELPPIPPEKTGPKVVVETGELNLDTDYDHPKQKYYERSDAEEQKTKGDSCYNSPPSRYNRQRSDDKVYNSPPSRYTNVQPPDDDSYNMPPPNRYKSLGGDSGLGASVEGIREVGHNPLPNSPEMVLRESARHQEMKEQEPTDGFYNVAPSKRFTQDSDECYNVPRPGMNWNQHITGGAAWNQHQANSANWNECQTNNRWNFQPNLRPDSEDCYNIPKSQRDKRKHVSQGEECYNIPKSHPENWSTSCDLPRQKSDRRSYGGQGSVGVDRKQSSYYGSHHDPMEDYDVPKPGDFPRSYGSSYNPEEDYNTPKPRNLSRPESGHGDLGLYNIPGPYTLTTAANDLFNRPLCLWEKPKQQMPFSEDRPIQAYGGVHDPARGLNEGVKNASEHHHPVAAGPRGSFSRVDIGNEFHFIPPSSASFTPSSGRHLQEPEVSKQPVVPASPPSSVQQTMSKGPRTELPSVAVSDVKPLSVAEDESRSLAKAEMDGENAKSSELKKTPSGAYKQNKSVQSSTSLHKKQGVSSLPIHDSIRFTQRTKSFKRSMPSQDRSMLPLPVKRIVERSESSSASSSDDESDQNSSTHSNKHS